MDRDSGRWVDCIDWAYFEGSMKGLVLRRHCRYEHELIIMRMRDDVTEPVLQRELSRNDRTVPMHFGNCRYEFEKLAVPGCMLSSRTGHVTELRLLVMLCCLYTCASLVLLGQSSCCLVAIDLPTKRQGSRLHRPSDFFI